MTYNERDGWDEVGDQGNGILGAHLKFAKGRVFLDGAQIGIGDDGIRFCIIMDSATAGKVLWKDQKIAERDVGRVADGFMPRRAEMQEDWNAYVSFQVVRADKDHIGELCTFTSSSWGGWYAFDKLINQFRLKQKRQFPICTIATKERGDVNGNIDPVFKICGWSARSNFGDLLNPTQIDAPATVPAIEATPTYADVKPRLSTINGEPVSYTEAGPQRTADIIDDDIPF